MRQLAPYDLSKLIKRLVQAWDTVRWVLGKLRYHSTYEILDRDGDVETPDPRGEQATLIRREVPRFLHDNGAAIDDHAWGDEELFAGCNCQPGMIGY